jgi:cytochrome c5
MAHGKNKYKVDLLMVTAAVALGVFVMGCQNAGNAPAPAGAAPSSAASATPHKGAAELWSETCSRCHNLRDPKTYNDDQWTVAMHHMRVRAQLTGEEERVILQFLKTTP